jgi:hypothetical protein
MSNSNCISRPSYCDASRLAEKSSPRLKAACVGIFCLFPVLCGEISLIAAETEETLLSRIERLGGKVGRSKIEEGMPVVQIDLSNCEFKDDDLAGLGSLGHLKVLRLQFSSISDSGLKHLKGLMELYDLNLANTKVTDEGLKHVGKLKNLERLHLDSTSISGTGLKELGGLEKLTVLELGDIKTKMGSLRSLQNLKNLRILDLSFNPITDDDTKVLEDLDKLERVFLTNTKVSPERIRELAKKLPKAEIIKDN